MAKRKTKLKSKSQAEKIKASEPSYKASEEKTTSIPIKRRKIVTPGRQGTVSITAIRKVVKEVIAQRSISNECRLHSYGDRPETGSNSKIS